MLSLNRGELCRKREAGTMVRRFAPWLINQLNLAMSIRLGIYLTEEQTQRINDHMQEMIEDILTDYGMRPVTKIAAVPLMVVAGSADAGSIAHCPDGLAQAVA
jgi:hypothetical protein